MKKFIETLKNCWKIEDLRQRLLITLLFTAIYRLARLLYFLVSIRACWKTSVADLWRSYVAFGHVLWWCIFQCVYFALGIMPYISASIVMQLLAVAVPYFQKMQREGESGRKKYNGTLES